MVFYRTYSGDYLLAEQGFEVDESDHFRRGRPLIGRQLSLPMTKKSPNRRNIFRTRSGSQTRSGNLTRRGGSLTRKNEKNKKQNSGRKLGKPNRRRLLSLPSLMDDYDRAMVVRNVSELCI